MIETMILENSQQIHPDFPENTFRLGMPHMSSTGVQRSWLLREATHRHWALIAAQVGVHPTEFRDKSGARVLASVVACTLNGDADAFKEDDLCELQSTQHPSAKNGWRSQLDLTSNGKSIRAEIVTSFAKRNGASNTNLMPADLEASLQADREHEDARRTNLIRTLGKADREQAEKDTAPPHLSFEMCNASHVNGVGLVYFANIHDMLALSERNAVPQLVSAYPMRNRRVHYFGNIDVGDTLELISRASAQSFTPTASVVVQSHARRGSDGKLIACSESIYGY